MGVFKFLGDNFAELKALVPKTQSKPEEDTNKDELPADVLLSFADTRADKVKDAFIEFSSIAVPLTLLVSLIASNGYFFSGFKAFTLTDFNVTLQWSVGAAIELATASLLYLAARSKKKGRKNWYSSLLGAAVLLVISIVAQYMYLKSELKLSDASVGNIPVFGWLVGVGGMTNADVFYFLRSVAMHGAEVFSVFLLVPRGMTIEKLLELQRKKHEYNSQRSMQSMSLSLEKSIQEVMTSVMEQQKLSVISKGKELLEPTNKKEAVPYNREISNVVPVPFVRTSKDTPLDFQTAPLKNLGNQSSKPPFPLSRKASAVDAETTQK